MAKTTTIMKHQSGVKSYKCTYWKLSSVLSLDIVFKKFILSQKGKFLCSFYLKFTFHLQGCRLPVILQLPVLMTKWENILDGFKVDYISAKLVAKQKNLPPISWWFTLGLLANSIYYYFGISTLLYPVFASKSRYRLQSKVWISRPRAKLHEQSGTRLTEEQRRLAEEKVLWQVSMGEATVR